MANRPSIVRNILLICVSLLGGVLGVLGLTTAALDYLGYAQSIQQLQEPTMRTHVLQFLIGAPWWVIVGMFVAGIGLLVAPTISTLLREVPRPRIKGKIEAFHRWGQVEADGQLGDTWCEVWLRLQNSGTDTNLENWDVLAQTHGGRKVACVVPYSQNGILARRGGPPTRTIYDALKNGEGAEFAFGFALKGSADELDFKRIVVTFRDVHGNQYKIPASNIIDVNLNGGFGIKDASEVQ
jgi:hypothetical protein